jgi:glycosyltransferase involved in cell wall biosynthesis
MAELLADRVAQDAKIHVAENWADGAKIIPFPFPGGPLTVLYSGNLGLAHDVTTIREAMLRLRDDGRFQFAFSGGGQLRNQMQEFCSKNGLRSVSFLPYCELAALGQRLAMGHVGLVTQKNETLGCVVPSKIYGIIAAGRPVLFIGPKGATAARIVDRFRCGWNLEPGDVDGLIALLDLLAENPDLMRAAGNRGRAAFEQHYDMHAGVSRICRILRSHMEDHVFARAAGD